jgi:EAL domain-containing protein (putative c-di-GMP-specific phosphodiesterase class I)
VETEAQHDMLERWGCGEVQGFFFAEPLSVDVITRLLRDGNPLRPRARAETVA